MYLINFILLAFPIYLIAQPASIKLVTGELPPYSYKEENKIIGVASDVVDTLKNRVGYSHNIKFYPWARALKLSTEKGTITYPLARLPYREQSYRWIGPLLVDSFVFIVKASDSTDFTSLEDLKNMSIGVNRFAPTEKRLIKKGFKNIDQAGSEIQNGKKFIMGRFDAWYTTHLMAKHIFKKLGVEKNKYTVAFVDLEVSMYLAASLDLVSEAPIWQAELNRMKSDGAYQKILQGYGL